MSIENRIPQTAIVLGGDWKKGQDTESRPSLTYEARIRVLAAGQLALNGDINTILFTGGLKAGVENIPEGAAMADYFRRHNPRLESVQIFEENESFDTTTNAELSKCILDENNILGPYTLLTTAIYLKRQDRIFRRYGLDTVPLAAEDVLAARSSHHKSFSERYQKSPRISVYLNSKELLLRGLMAAGDKDAKISRALARKARV